MQVPYIGGKLASYIVYYHKRQDTRSAKQKNYISLGRKAVLLLGLNETEFTVGRNDNFLDVYSSRTNVDLVINQFRMGYY